MGKKSNETEECIFNNFKKCMYSEYIQPITNQMGYYIENNINDDHVNELKFSNVLFKVAKIHDQHNYVKFIESSTNNYIRLFNILRHNDLKVFCIHQIIKISN